MNRTKISAEVEGHGTYSCDSAIFDLMISSYLPASPNGLRAICEERSSVDLSDVRDVSVFLTMLGDWHEGEARNEEASARMMPAKLTEVEQSTSVAWDAEAQTNVATVSLKLSRASANVSTIVVGDLTVYFSYDTPIAFLAPGCGLVARENDWGPTTGRHLNQVDNGDKDSRVSSEVFELAMSEALKEIGR